MMDVFFPRNIRRPSVFHLNHSHFSSAEIVAALGSSSTIEIRKLAESFGYVATKKMETEQREEYGKQEMLLDFNAPSTNFVSIEEKNVKVHNRENNRYRKSVGAYDVGDGERKSGSYDDF